MLRPPLCRDAFPVAQRWAYLNHAGVAPLATPVVEAAHAGLLEASLHGSGAVEAQKERAERVRAAGARLLGVPVDDVAFVKNTTEGLGFVANGLAWAPGDRVVVPDLEFPSTIYPWLGLRDRGVVVDLVAPVGPEGVLEARAYAEVIDRGPPPKVVATSWVQFGRGWRSDLAALAEITHEAGALLCVDVIQGLGAIPARLEAWGVDFAMADAHKWLLGPAGIGLLYVRSSVLDRLRVLEPGWSSVAHAEEWGNRTLRYDHRARRLEGGTPNVAGTDGLLAALDLLEDVGVEAVWAHVNACCDHLVAGLTELGATVVSDRSPRGRSGIVTFTLPGDAPEAVCASLLATGVVASPRGDGIRVSPHGYNDEEDLDRLLVALARR